MLSYRANINCEKEGFKIHKNIVSTHFKIMDCIKCNYCTPNEIAVMLNISLVQTYRYLHDLEYYFNEKNLHKIREKLLRELKYEKVLKEEQGFTSEERRIYIILNFIKLEVANISQLIEELEVTRRTLSSDLYKLNVDLEKYNLKLISLNSQGVSLGGLEEDKRKLFRDYFMKIIFNWKFLPTQFSRFVICFKSYEKNENLNGIIIKILDEAGLKKDRSALKFWMMVLFYISSKRQEYQKEEKALKKEEVQLLSDVSCLLKEKSYNLMNYEKMEIYNVIFDKKWLKNKKNTEFLINDLEYELDSKLGITKEEYEAIDNLLNIMAIKKYLNITEENLLNINSSILKSKEFKILKGIIDIILEDTNKNDKIAFLFLLLSIFYKKIENRLELQKGLILLYSATPKILIENTIKALNIKKCCKVVSIFDIETVGVEITGIILLEDLQLNKNYEAIPKLRLNYPVSELDRLLLYKLIKKS